MSNVLRQELAHMLANYPISEIVHELIEAALTRKDIDPAAERSAKALRVTCNLIQTYESFT